MAVELQPQKSIDTKRHRGGRGEAYLLRKRMELVEIFRHYSKRTDVKVTASNLGKFIHIPFQRQIIKHFQIECLPPNSTSVAQPLDAGIISVFKQHYLEMLSNKAVTKEYAAGEKITNGEAWPLIPYAWPHAKAVTVRHCFCKPGVISKVQADKLEHDSMEIEKRSSLYPPMSDTEASQDKRRNVRLIALAMNGDKIKFSLDKNHKDAQDMPEEIKQKLHSKIAKRYGSRDRSSSIKLGAVESFKSKYEGQSLVTMVIELIG
ncbi:hypothetical protein BGZ47_004323, partial [Haplosporangium gracile]